MPGGQLTRAVRVENYPGFPDGIPGHELIERMRKQARGMGVHFAEGNVEKFSVHSDGIKVCQGSSGEWRSKTVVVAVGSRERTLGIPGEAALSGGRGVGVCATCDGFFYRDRDVAVIGGGDTACEEALFLTRFCSTVTLVHRRNQLRASPILVEKVLCHPKIKVLLETVPLRFVAGNDGHLSSVELQTIPTQKSFVLECRAVFVAVGHHPNTEIFADCLPMDGDGFLKPLSPLSVETCVPGVFVAGDCVDRRYRQAVVAAAWGCRAATDAVAWLNRR
jgi:thioredoxin reductase (NADPH)